MTDQSRKGNIGNSFIAENITLKTPLPELTHTGVCLQQNDCKVVDSNLTCRDDWKTDSSYTQWTKL